jgi:hypothetical protein
MTKSEIQVEVERLREQLSEIQQQQQSQEEQWRHASLIGSLNAILYAVIGGSFLLADFFLDLAHSRPMTHQFLYIMGFVFIITSLPLPLFSQALRSK